MDVLRRYNVLKNVACTDCAVNLLPGDRETRPIMGALDDRESLASINNLYSPSSARAVESVLQSAVFIEDGVYYRSINHKIDRLSLFLYRIYHSRYIRWSKTLVISALLALAFFEFPTSLSLSSDPRYRPLRWHAGEPACGATESVELILLLLLSLDCVAQFYLLGWKRFVKRPWLDLYAGMMALSFVDIIISLAFCSDRESLGYTIRIRRFFRPLVFLLTSSVMKKYIKAIKLTLPQILNVLVLLLLHIYVFAMFGLLVFPQDELGIPTYHPPNGSVINDSAITNHTRPNEQFYEREEGEKFFNTVSDALVSLLVLLTTANHPDVRMPIYQFNRFAVLYFSLFLFIGMYLILNLLIAVIYTQFKGFFRKSLQSSFFRRRVAFRAAFTILAHATNRHQRPGHELVSKELVRSLLQKVRIDRKKIPLMYHHLEMLPSEELTWVQFRDVFDLISRVTRQRRDTHAELSQRYLLQLIQIVIRHRYFAYFTYGVSIVHVILMTIELRVDYRGALEQPNSRLAFYNLFFIIYYSIEQVVKVLVHRWRFFLRIGNVYECFVTFMLAVLEIVIIGLFHSPFRTDLDDVQTFDILIRVTNIFIILRLLRLVPHIKSLSLLTGTIVELIKNLRGFTGIIVVIYYLFALLGMELFMILPSQNGTGNGSIPLGSLLQDDDSNGTNYTSTCGTYENLGYYANNFNDFAASLVVLFDVMVVNNWYVYLFEYKHTSSLGQWSQLFFIAWWLVAVVICVNLFISLMLDTFLLRWEAVQRQRQMSRQAEEQHERFTESAIWDDAENSDTQVSDIQSLLQGQLVEPDEADIMHELQKHGDLVLV